MNNLINQKNKFDNFTKAVWDTYERVRIYKYWFRATTKKTSTSLGNQDGYVDDLPNAPPLSLKLENIQFKQERTQWIRLKSLGLKCT